MAPVDEQLKPKRKTRTSPAAVKRYKEKNYAKFQVDVRKDLYQQIEDYIALEGISKSEFLRRAIAALAK